MRIVNGQGGVVVAFETETIALHSAISDRFTRDTTEAAKDGGLREPITAELVKCRRAIEKILVRENCLKAPPKIRPAKKPAVAKKKRKIAKRKR